MTVVLCQEEVSATGRSLVQRSPIGDGVSECEFEASIMDRPWPTSSSCAMKRRGELCAFVKGNQSQTATSRTVAFMLLLLTVQKYEGWNFNSGNYLFTTDTK